MFTHSTVNFTWHQVSEHTLLHDSYLSKRKEEEGRPSPCNVLYSPFLSFMPPVILCLVFLGPATLKKMPNRKKNFSHHTWRVAQSNFFHSLHNSLCHVLCRKESSTINSFGKRLSERYSCLYALLHFALHFHLQVWPFEAATDTSAFRCGWTTRSVN